MRMTAAWHRIAKVAVVIPVKSKKTLNVYKNTQKYRRTLDVVNKNRYQVLSKKHVTFNDRVTFINNVNAAQTTFGQHSCATQKK